MTDGTIVQIRVDIGFPHKSFLTFPHLLILRNHDEIEEAVILARLGKVPQESSLYLGSCAFTGNYEWCLWCDHEAANALAGCGCEGLGEEAFFTENDFGDFFRSFLIPSEFKVIAESSLALCLQLQEEDIDISAKHKVRHWLEFDDPRSVLSFLDAAEELGFRTESREDTAPGARLRLLEWNNLEVETRHHSVAMLFDLAVRASGRHEGWEVDLT
jgi:hypothetical protein